MSDTKTPVEQIEDAAEEASVIDSDEEFHYKRYELGGREWHFMFPIPGILMLRMAAASTNEDGSALAIFLDILESVVAPEELEDFNKRLVGRPVITTEDLNALMEWIVQEGSGNLLE